RRPRRGSPDAGRGPVQAGPDRSHDGARGGPALLRRADVGSNRQRGGPAPANTGASLVCNASLAAERGRGQRGRVEPRGSAAEVRAETATQVQRRGMTYAAV